MKIALIGHGAMGKLIERLAIEKGHEIAGIIGDSYVFLDSPIRSGATTAQAPERTAAQKQSGRLRSIPGQPSLVSRKSATPRCRYFRRCSRKADARQPRSQMERRYTAVFL